MISANVPYKSSRKRARTGLPDLEMVPVRGAMLIKTTRCPENVIFESDTKYHKNIKYGLVHCPFPLRA